MSAASSRGGPLRVLVLSDGVVGHDRISLGVTAALRRRSAVTAFALPIREARKASRRWDRALARLQPFERFWTQRFVIAPDAPNADLGASLSGLPDENGVDVVVSAGPATAAATIALARRCRAASVYFGFPKFPLVAEFDVLLRPDHSNGMTRGVTVLRPSEIDPDGLPPAAVPVRRVALLIGGDTKHYAFDAADFEALARTVESVAARGMAVTVFNSRRTSGPLFDALLARIAPLKARVTAVDARTAAFRSNMAAFSVDAVVVTADSMSMAAEAIAARRRVVIASPDRYRAPARDAAETKAHVGGGLAAVRSFSELADGGWVYGLGGLTPSPDHPLDRLAAILAAALPILESHRAARPSGQ